ncbi:pentapeptide repeat-containing protein [Anatilimnocola floriformis]|uniref:pentapeptide repeat-containing protein n=1 Tax=Anatilimnocola floriformis TaxID=2948575 RepID=UPI0020C38BEB|nr:pentapeptide repeat-containing protein [Anatilimnocola floriformis]
MLRQAICAVLLSSLLSTLSVLGSEPITPAAIAALAAECKSDRKAMDLIARFGNDFAGLDLSGVDFRGVHTAGLETNLRKANFSGAKLAKAQFGAAILDGADFSGADLTDAEFVTASLRGANLQESTLTRTQLQWCDLTRANLGGNDLSTTLLTSSDFKQANLAGCALASVNREYGTGYFERADLTGADLHGLSLVRANFRGAILCSANLQDADLEETDFTGADLQEADLTNAKLHAAIFYSVRGISEKELRELQRQARRWEFDLQAGIQCFLGSPLFPLALLVVIPSAAWATGWTRNRRPDLAQDHPQPVRQYSISSLLFATFFIALFLGTGLWSATGLFSLTMVTAFCLMIEKIVFNRPPRPHAIAPLVVGLSYAALNAVCVLLLRAESIMLLAALAILIFPPTALIAVIATFKFRGWPLLTWELLGLAIWLGGIAFANLWFFAEIFASV